MPLSGKGGLEKLNASIYDCERWEKTHRKRSLHPVSHLYLAGMGGRIAMPHSSLFITRILGKRNTGGIYHPSCAFHIPGLSLQMAQDGLDTTVTYRQIWRFYTWRHGCSPRSFPKAISKLLVSVWETSVTQGQWLLLWGCDLWLLVWSYSLSPVLFPVVVNVIGTLSSTWGFL